MYISRLSLQVLKRKELRGETAIVYGQEGEDSKRGVPKSQSAIQISLIPDVFSAAYMAVQIWASLSSGTEALFT